MSTDRLPSAMAAVLGQTPESTKRDGYIAEGYKAHWSPAFVSVTVTHVPTGLRYTHGLLEHENACVWTALEKLKLVVAEVGLVSELEMYRADHASVKAAGWESVGELLSAYKTQAKNHAELQLKLVEANARINAQTLSFNGLDDRYSKLEKEAAHLRQTMTQQGRENQGQLECISRYVSEAQTLRARLSAANADYADATRKLQAEKVSNEILRESDQKLRRKLGAIEDAVRTPSSAY